MIEKAQDILYRLEAALGAVFFAGMCVAVVLQVFYRYVLQHPLVWPFEFSIYCYVFIIYIGGAMAARRGTHVAFDMLGGRLPKRARAVLSALVNIFIAVVLALTLWPSVGYMGFLSDVRSSALGIPWAWVMAVYPAGMGLIVVHLLLRALVDLRFLAAGGDI